MIDVLLRSQPAECALLLVDHQAGLAFGVGSTDRQILRNNTVALARTATAFELPIVVSRSAAKVYGAPLMPAIHVVLPDGTVIERRSMNLWEAAKDHPEAIDRLVVMDNVPTRIVAREMNASIGKAYWFFLFHLVPDLPEALIAGREDLWLRHFFSDWCYNPLAISGEAFETYVKAYRRPGAVRGAMDDYRANAEDVAQDMADADVKIACPTLALWGADYYAVGKMFDMPRVWAEMAGDLRNHAIPQCGHLPQEEQPEIVNRLLLDFLEGWIG
jgi:pimeloyl-ACP methyl ester carboxylesterase